MLFWKSSLWEVFFELTYEKKALKKVKQRYENNGIAVQITGRGRQ